MAQMNSDYVWIISACQLLAFCFPPYALIKESFKVRIIVDIFSQKPKVPKISAS
jgi:hypothetical protein